jgi:hypothetical protein
MAPKRSARLSRSKVLDAHKGSTREAEPNENPQTQASRSKDGGNCRVNESPIAEEAEDESVLVSF